jgi:hypothetical protein
MIISNAQNSFHKFFYKKLIKNYSSATTINLKIEVY